jgi:enamine deaminase RidA (YjgF/YER057c/UK114 family)
MIRKRFFAIVPRSGLSVEEQLTDIFRSLDDLLPHKGGPWSGILKQTLFLRAGDRADFMARSRILKPLLCEHFGPLFPPTSVIGQPPEQECQVALEIMTFDRPVPDIAFSLKDHGDIRYLLVEYPEGKEIIGAGLTAEDPSGETAKLSERAFLLMNEILTLEGLDFSHVVRQWNYIEQIVGMDSGRGARKQNYQQFNDVRSRFYRSARWPRGYPSATGIGMNTGGIVIEFIAASGPSSWLTLPLSNPLQEDAHQYSQQVLVGDSLQGEGRKTSPKFERAKLVFSPEGGQVYISGTAAIRGESTVPEEDAAGQTKATLENILALTSAENLRRSGFGLEIVETNVSYLRVYVKREEDIPAVKKVCRDILPGTPALYVISDVCRPDLLVEIEGILDFSI